MFSLFHSVTAHRGKSLGSFLILSSSIVLLILTAGTVPSRAQQLKETIEHGGEAKSPPTANQPVPSVVAKEVSLTRTTVPDCAGGEAFRRLANTANSPAIIYNGNLVPAGSAVEFGLRSSLASDARYFALLIDEDTIPRDDNRHGARARKAGDSDDLVARRLLSPGDTIVSVDVPASDAGFWNKRNLYIYQCDDTRRPFNVSYLPVYVSPMGWSIAIAIMVVAAVYFFAAKAFARLLGKSLAGTQAWNPIRITAGFDNRGSLSAFQVFFFTILVFAMLLFVLLRTGVLSDLSTTILELLGISGIGAAAAKGADSSRTVIDPTNQAWLLNKGWYTGPSIRAANEPSFFDLISSDGAFDVYRFQSLLFTLAVGAALFLGGVFQLASFTVPQNILGILGLSQVVYIAGKLVSSNGATQLNSVITDLRNAETEFRQTVFSSQTTTASGVPASLQEAIDRAGPSTYARYLDKAKGAAQLFASVTGLAVDRQKLEPSIGVT